MIRVIKVGGGVVEDTQSLHMLLDAFAALDGDKVLVHGGGRLATTLATQMNIPTHMVEGRRITDAETLRVVTMVYGGLVNKQIVAELEKRHISAIGLTGADMSVIRAHRRPVTNDIDYGFVGDIDKVDAQRLIALIQHDVVPVISPLSSDGQGQLLNTNADTIASETAIALAQVSEQVQLIYCFELPSVLRDAQDPTTIIPDITPTSYATLKSEGIISGGMIPKLDNAFAALSRGVKQVRITSITALDGGTLIHA